MNHDLDLNMALNYDRDTALLLSLSMRRPTIAKRLIQAGAKVDCINTECVSAMDIVLNCSSLCELSYLLLLAGCKINSNQLQKSKSKNVFDPQSYEAMTFRAPNPLSLQSLCRSSIRKCLQMRWQNKSILSAIKQLPMPSMIKSYVSLETFGP